MGDSFNGVAVPANGARITYSNGQYQVPDNPIVPFIEGDGTGRDIWKASVRVFDAAVEKAYKGKRRVAWYEVFAGEKAMAKFETWLPDDSVAAIREFRVAIKGPLTTPVGGGIRSLNVALRQILDLYCCVRPVKYYKGVPSPVKHPERMDVVIYPREYGRRLCRHRVGAGNSGSGAADRVPEQGHAEGRQEAGAPGFGRRHQADLDHRDQAAGAHGDQVCAGERAQERDPGAQGKHPEVYRRGVPQVGIRAGDRGVSRQSSDRARELDSRQQGQESQACRSRRMPHLIEPGMEFAPPKISGNRYLQEVKDVLDAIYATHGKGAWKKKLMINDRIADSIFQQVVTRADEYSVLATSEPERRLHFRRVRGAGGRAWASRPAPTSATATRCFEATHGTAPKYADKDVINPGSVILSGVMMFRFLGWNEAADLMEHGLERTIEQKKVTYDFERLMEGATKVKTSEFAELHHRKHGRGRVDSD